MGYGILSGMFGQGGGKEDWRDNAVNSALLRAGAEMMARSGPSRTPQGLLSTMGSAIGAGADQIDKTRMADLQTRSIESNMESQELQRQALERQAAAAKAEAERVARLRASMPENDPRRYMSAAGLEAIAKEQYKDRAPAGYRTVDGKLVPIPGGPGDPAQAKRLADARRDPFIVQQIYDPTTNSMKTVAVPREDAARAAASGQPIGGGKPIKETGEASKTAGYANRMTKAETIMQGLEGKGFNPASPVEAARGLTNMTASPEYQQYRQAQEDWVRAKLRRESGAVIGEQEMADEIKTYFPRVGDSPEVIQQKAQARKTATEGLIAEGQGAYRRLFGNEKKASGRDFSGMTIQDLGKLDIKTLSARDMRALDAELKRRGF